MLNKSDGNGGGPSLPKAACEAGSPLGPDAYFNTVLGEHGAFLLGLARRLAPTLGVDPEDVVQDTLERAWRSRESFRGECSTRVWVCAILTNRVRELARSRLRLSGHSWRLYRAEVACQRLAENPEELILRAADEEELRGALTALPFWERTAVLLHDCAGLSAWEVATVLGCSTAAAHKRIQRGRVRLAAELGRRSRGKALPRLAPSACRQARKLVPFYLEGSLPDTERRALEAHIAECPRCPALVQVIWALLSVLAHGNALSEEQLVRFRARARAFASETLDQRS